MFTTWAAVLYGPLQHATNVVTNYLSSEYFVAVSPMC